MPRPRRARSVVDLNLAEVTEIVSQDAELRQMLVELSRRSAGGAKKSGRYNLHDTALLRSIRDTALQGIRLGILVQDADLRMLRLEPQEQLRRRGGPDWVAMEAWAKRHGSRSQQPGRVGGAVPPPPSSCCCCCWTA